MNLEKVVFGFFVLLAATLNFGFVIGELDNANQHERWELAAALVVSLIATVLKLGDRTHIGAVLLATSLVADLQLIAAALVWAIAAQVYDAGETPRVISAVVSLAAGAVLANLASVVLLLAETISLRR